MTTQSSTHNSSIHTTINHATTVQTKHRIAQWLALLALLSTLHHPPAILYAQGTAFTYQGRLDDSSNPVTGTYDLRFTIYDSTNTPGNLIAGPITNSATAVSNGLFIATLDFGAGVFTGAARWLDIAVRTNGTGVFTTLAPRQQLTPTPYAVMANSASNVLGTIPLANLPASLVTNNETGVTLTNLTLGGALNLYSPEITSGGNVIFDSASANQSFFAGMNAGNPASDSGGWNTAVGFLAMANDTTGGENAASGANALLYNTTGGENTANGAFALYLNTNGTYNTANGHSALAGNKNGSYNTASGAEALNANVSGSYNIALGYNAGVNITGSSNIDIGHGGLVTDTNIIRLGSGQTAAYLAGTMYGNGGGLTNLNATNVTGTFAAAQLPASVVTNNETGVTLSGAFAGNGSGLTNVTAAALAIPPGMALVPAGSFTMGNSIGDSDITDANPTNVFVSAFYLDVNLVSYSQWLSVYYWATNHGFSFDYAGSGKAANHPVQTVDWYDAVKWCNARSQQAGRTPVYYTDAGLMHIYTNGDVVAVYVNWTNNGYRLPTEAEWEKAARGGLTGQRFPWGNIISENLANYYGYTSLSYDLGPAGYNSAFNTGSTPYTSPGSYFAPNGYGLYDMAGNLEQWCWDWYGTPYGQPATNNPTGPASGSYRVLRNSYWAYYANQSRCAFRTYNTMAYANTYVGFRCVVRGY